MSTVVMQVMTIAAVSLGVVGCATVPVPECIGYAVSVVTDDEDEAQVIVPLNRFRLILMEWARKERGECVVPKGGTGV